ncbi:hypothetical protein HDG37_001778 [Paraburkholderia sp. MM5384-R2]|nr:hypothetical protein [Paraburkholderia sp. MM5384-R2]
MVARRGYRLAPSEDVPPIFGTVASPRPLPRRVGNFVVRDVVVAKAAEAMVESQVLTLTGLGGVGKSSLALTLGRDDFSRHFDAATARDGNWHLVNRGEGRKIDKGHPRRA